MSDGSRFQEQFDDLNRQVAELYRQEQFERAMVIAQQLCIFAEQHWGQNNPNYATSLNNIAELDHETGHYANAERFYQQAIEIRRRTVGELNPDLACSLNCLAELYRQTGRFAEAEIRQQEAIHIRRTSLGADHPEFAQSVNNLGALYRAMGRHTEAESLYRQAIEIRRKALGKLRPDLATSLNNLALLYDSMGRYTEAERLYLQANEIWLATLGGNHSHYAAGLNNLAMLYDSMGQYANAESLYRQAMEIWRTTLGEKHPNYATCLNNLAELYRTIGQYALAEPLYRREIEICRATQGENNPSYATSLNNLAALYRSMGQYGQAEPLYLQALEIRRATVGETHPSFAESLSNVAVFYESIGRYAEAERLQQQAIEIRREKLGEAHPSFATSLNNLAALYRATGQNARAEPYYEQALKIRRKTLGETHPNVAQSLNNLAVLYVATDRAERGLELMSQAAAVHRQLIGQVFTISSENRRMAFLQRMRAHYDVFLSLVWEYQSNTPTAVAAAFELVLARKGIGIEALAVQRDAVLAGRYPELKSDLDGLTVLRRQIAQKTLTGPGKEGLEAHEQSLRTWNEQKELIETDLARGIPEMSLEQQSRRVTRQAVTLGLPQGTVLVEFVRFDVFDFKAVRGRGELPWQPARYLAFVLHAGQADQPEMIDLGEAEQIDEIIRLFRNTVTRNLGDQQGRTLSGLPEMAELVVASCGQRLRQAIFDPLRPALRDSKRLFFCLDGDLNRLPFEALPLGTDGRHLLDEYRFSYLSSGRDVLRFVTQPSSTTAAAVVAADPDFDLGSGRIAPLDSLRPAHSLSRDLERGHRATRLPGTRTEGERVAALLGVEPLLADAVLDSRLQSLRSPRILHLATHGFFLPDQPHESNQRDLTFLGDDRLWSGRFENPLLRSGLLLAGFNVWNAGGSPPPEAEDGVLTAEDVTGLDLLETELVVLSACETGLGQVHAGEGVFGLRRAFVLAGAKTLVMSLWRVPDEATRELMEGFYQGLLLGEGKANALRNAQLALRQQYPDPYYWGAFICHGDPGPLSRIQPSRITKEVSACEN